MTMAGQKLNNQILQIPLNHTSFWEKKFHECNIVYFLYLLAHIFFLKKIASLFASFTAIQIKLSIPFVSLSKFISYLSPKGELSEVGIC